MKVVEHDQQRLSLGGGGKKGDHGVEQPEAGFVGLAQRASWQLGHAADLIAQFRRDLRDLRSARPHPAREFGRLDVPRQSA